MIIIFIFIFVLLLGLVFIHVLNSKFDVEVPGILLTSFGSICLTIAVIYIIVSHACANYNIQKNKIEYEGLCKRYEIVKSEYEDVSKSDVIGDITEWNKKVYNIKYWAENPWTNWFNSKKISDNLDYIQLGEKEE